MLAIVNMLVKIWQAHVKLEMINLSLNVVSKKIQRSN
jgi:hypothetical protein